MDPSKSTSNISDNTSSPSTSKLKPSTETPTPNSAKSSGRKSKQLIKDGKVIVRFKPVGNAPIMKQTKFKISVNERFQVIIEFLRKQLQFDTSSPLFLYINSSFAPSPDEQISNLAKSFHVDNILNINYCLQQAWG